MSKLDEKIEAYKAEAKKLGIELDDKLIEETTKALVPAIYNADAEVVSCTDQSELDRVRESFLKKKLGLKESDEVLDKLIKEVCEEMGSSNRKKYRAIFYSILKKKLDKVA
jgi:hypothetical protein